MFKQPTDHYKISYCKVSIRVVHGDLTEERVDAIVNAANEYLAHGGGVAGAIARKGGYSIQKESNEYISKNGVISVGGVAVTGAGSLPCRYVIHAVGPVYRNHWNNETSKLQQAIWNSLEKATAMKLHSISIPAISSGIFGFPKPLCARIMAKTAKRFIDSNPNGELREIRFTNNDIETVLLMKKSTEEVFGSDSGKGEWKKESTLEKIGGERERERESAGG